MLLDTGQDEINLDLQMDLELFRAQAVYGCGALDAGRGGSKLLPATLARRLLWHRCYNKVGSLKMISLR